MTTVVSNPILILMLILIYPLLRIKVHTLETPDNCTHEVAVPPNFEFTGLRESVSDDQ